MQVLNNYCLASVQKVNFEQSNMVFSPNILEPLREQLCGKFGINGAENAGIVGKIDSPKQEAEWKT